MSIGVYIFVTRVLYYRECILSLLFSVLVASVERLSKGLRFLTVTEAVSCPKARRAGHLANTYIPDHRANSGMMSPLPLITRRACGPIAGCVIMSQLVPTRPASSTYARHMCGSALLLNLKLLTRFCKLTWVFGSFPTPGFNTITTCSTVFAWRASICSTELRRQLRL